MSNITIDDTAVALIYGPGWGVASPNDPALPGYFQSTYHASETPGADVNLTFSGIAIYLYGSKGPNHGNFSVRYDSLVQLLSAQADSMEYQQLLFSAQFTSDTHSLTLTNTDTGRRWLDLDFVTVTGTGNASTTAGGFSSTISPPIVPTSSSTVTNDPSTSPSAIVTAPASSVSTVTLVLAIVFGVLFLCLLVGVCWFLIRRRSHRRLEEPNDNLSGMRSIENPQPMHTVVPAYYAPQSTSPPLSPIQQTQTGMPRSPLLSARSQGDSSMNHMRSFSDLEPDADVRQLGHSVPRQATSPTSRPWSPFSAQMGRMFGAPKDGADSMRSTFLKV